MENKISSLLTLLVERTVATRQPKQNKQTGPAKKSVNRQTAFIDSRLKLTGQSNESCDHVILVGRQELDIRPSENRRKLNFASYAKTETFVSTVKH